VKDLFFKCSKIFTIDSDSKGKNIEGTKSSFVKADFFEVLAYWFDINSPFLRRFFGSSSGNLAHFRGNSRRTPEETLKEYQRNPE